MTAEREEERRRGKARFEELARERYLLSQRAEDQLAGLLQTLEELRTLDQRQRRLAHHAVVSRQTLRTSYPDVLASWLSARFGGDSPGYLRVLRLPEYHEKRLAEVDGLAKKPERT
jgi:hypothetical protein